MQRIEAEMRYLSLCSGIEAASVAFEPLGWQPVAFSEIDPFPSAVLQHRFPNAPNWGDMTKFQEWPYVPIDLICGGTPCQSFSVAGLRKGLDDPRGNLMLTFGHILGKYRPTWFVWENVPGVLSSDAGRDFASFLELVTGQIVKPPKDDSGWRNAGAISGIDSAYGCAWRVLDAQYTRSPKYPRAVPQRRRRVFVVGYLGDWRRAAAVLLDSESLSRDPSPRREAGQRVAGTLKGGSGERGYPDPSDGNGGGLISVADVSPCVTNGPPFSRTGNERIEAEAMVVTKGSHWDGAAHPPLTQSHNTGGIAMSDQELFAQRGAGLVATARESGQGYWMDDDVAGTLDANMGMSGHKERPGLVAHTLSADGFDASEDGTGRGTPIVPCMSSGQANAEVTENRSPSLTCLHEAPIVAIRTAQTSANGHGIAEDVAHTLDQAQGQAVAFQAKQSSTSQAPSYDGISPSLDVAKAGGMSCLTPQMAVRRLLPVECERLQAFPDSWTDVPYRNKDTSPDGPRYKAIGNSMATNCMEWIGHRIEMVENDAP